jgi:magnesium chelatase family protein
LIENKVAQPRFHAPGHEMQNWGLLIMVIMVFVANLPAVMQQWRTDRPGYIDLQIEVPAVSAADLVLPQASEGSAEVRARVTAARRAQLDRYAALGLTRIRTNAECGGAMLEQIAAPDRAGLTLLREAADALSLSARGYHRTLRVARTLADLDGEEKVARIHVAEALSYRGETLRRAQEAA